MGAVAAHAGETFASATQLCIEGGTYLGLKPHADHEDPYVSGTIQQIFYDQVYMRLKSINT